MGNADIESKEFMRDNAHFADVVNYYVFSGRQIVLPDDLSPLDTAEVVTPITRTRYQKQERAIGKSHKKRMDQQ